MRNASTDAESFADSARIISAFLFYEAIKHFPVASTDITTPLERTTCMTMDPSKKICIVPILRAGLVMSGVLERIIPNSSTYHIGLKRNAKTFEPVCYYENLPNAFSSQTDVYICDPMLATGGSICLAVEMCLSRGILAPNISVLCIISCKKGIERVFKTFPEIKVITTSVDAKLDDKAHIIPGLGDAGDRIFETSHH
jgi:uracil phosphoribosyltransferase